MRVRTGEIRKAGGPEKRRWLVEVREDGEWIGGRAELGWLLKFFRCASNLAEVAL